MHLIPNAVTVRPGRGPSPGDRARQVSSRGAARCPGTAPRGTGDAVRLRAPPSAGSLLWLWGWHWPFVRESPQGSPSSRKLSLQMSPGQGVEGDSQGPAQPLGHLTRGQRRWEAGWIPVPRPCAGLGGTPGSSLQPGLWADAALGPSLPPSLSRGRTKAPGAPWLRFSRPRPEHPTRATGGGQRAGPGDAPAG